MTLAPQIQQGQPPFPLLPMMIYSLWGDWDNAQMDGGWSYLCKIGLLFGIFEFCAQKLFLVTIAKLYCVDVKLTSNLPERPHFSICFNPLWEYFLQSSPLSYVFYGNMSHTTVLQNVESHLASKPQDAFDWQITGFFPGHCHLLQEDDWQVYLLSRNFLSISCLISSAFERASTKEHLRDKNPR